MLGLSSWGVGLISHSVQIVAGLRGVVLSLELLDAMRPAPAVVDLRPFVFCQFVLWEVGKSMDEWKGSHPCL